jgi:hypothetical protein
MGGQPTPDRCKAARQCGLVRIEARSRLRRRHGGEHPQTRLTILYCSTDRSVVALP